MPATMDVGHEGNTRESDKSAPNGSSSSPTPCPETSDSQRPDQEVGIVLWQVVQDIIKSLFALADKRDHILLLMPPNTDISESDLRDSCLHILVQQILFDHLWRLVGLLVEVERAPWEGLLFELEDRPYNPIALRSFVREVFGGEQKGGNGFILYPFDKNKLKNGEAGLQGEQYFTKNETHIKKKIGQKQLKSYKKRAEGIVKKVSTQNVTTPSMTSELQDERSSEISFPAHSSAFSRHILSSGPQEKKAHGQSKWCGTNVNEKFHDFALPNIRQKIGGETKTQFLSSGREAPPSLEFIYCYAVIPFPGQFMTEGGARKISPAKHVSNADTVTNEALEGEQRGSSSHVLEHAQKVSPTVSYALNSSPVLQQGGSSFPASAESGRARTVSRAACPQLDSTHNPQTPSPITSTPGIQNLLPEQTDPARNSSTKPKTEEQKKRKKPAAIRQEMLQKEKRHFHVVRRRKNGGKAAVGDDEAWEQYWGEELKKRERWFVDNGRDDQNAEDLYEFYGLWMVRWKEKMEMEESRRNGNVKVKDEEVLV